VQKGSASDKRRTKGTPKAYGEGGKDTKGQIHNEGMDRLMNSLHRIYDGVEIFLVVIVLGWYEFIDHYRM
jgi:hypothetical protein